MPHRSQTIADVGGIRYVNDSKATNVDSAAKALQAFKRIRWICGGLQKEGGVDELNAVSSDVVKAYVIGREAAQFAMQLTAETQVCTTMSEAVAAAMADAQDGEVVLLAPATASFDQYDSFERRGDNFIAEVKSACNRLSALQSRARLPCLMTMPIGSYSRPAIPLRRRPRR